MKKLSFPDDWSNLTEEQVLENIKYLSKHYKRYKVKAIDDKSVSVDNVFMKIGVRPNAQGVASPVIIINKKVIYQSDRQDLYSMTFRLMKNCRKYSRPFFKRIEDRLEDTELFSSYNGRPGIVLMISLALLIGCAVCARKASTKRIKREQKIEEYAKSLPGYQQMIETQEQIERYRDSLTKAEERF